MGVPNKSPDSHDPVQAEPEHRSTSDLDDQFDNSNPRNSGNDGQPGQLDGALSMSASAPAPSLSSDVTYGLPDYDFGPTSVPSISQEPNPSSDTITLQHEWNTELHLGPTLNNFRSPLFSPIEDTNPANFTGPAAQDPFSSIIGNYQSDVLQLEAELRGQEYGTSIGVIPLLSTAPNVGLGQDEGNVNTRSMPDWITLVKPRPSLWNHIITLRREMHVALDIAFGPLPRPPPVGCSGVKIPATGSVKNYADTAGRTLLYIYIHLYGATTGQRYETICLSCKKREGKKQGAPGMIDFHAEREILELKDGKVRVEFNFRCYPKDHQIGDNEYLLEVVLSEDDRQNNIVAQHRLPFSFNVVARLPPVPRNSFSLNSFGAPALLLPEYTLLTENPFPNETSSGTGFQGGDFPPVIPIQRLSEAVTSSSGSALTNDEALAVERNAHGDNPPAISTPPNVNESLNRDHDERDISLPQWIGLIKPLPWSGGNVIKLRRESHVALDIIPDRLPDPLPAGFGGIKIPATSSVVNPSETANKVLLEFRIHLYGATTKRRYEKVCPSCEKREAKKKGISSLIDFHAARDIIEPKGGKIRVEFTFCCYPKDHRLGDTEYLLDVILSNDDDQNNIVAQCRLPFSFNVLAKLPLDFRQRLLATQGRKRRADFDQAEGSPPALEPPLAPSRVDDANVLSQSNPPNSGQTHHPTLVVDQQDSLTGVQSSEENLSSSPPPVLRPQPSWNAGPSSNALPTRQYTMQALRTDGEPTPTLTEVNPESGPTTGGATIWLKGIDFPALFPLFARFGTNVVPTTFSASNLLACHLPSAATPGVVDVTLSKHPQPDAPEYGTSIAKFHYLGDHELLIPVLMRIQGQGYPEFTPVFQAMLSGLNRPQPSRGLRGGHGARAQPQDDPIEPSLIGAPRCLQARPTFYGAVSTMNHDKHSHVFIYRAQQLRGSARSPRRVAHWLRDFRRQRSQLHRYEERPGQRTRRAVVPLKLLPSHQAAHLRAHNRQYSHLHWPSTLVSPRRLLVPPWPVSN